MAQNNMNNLTTLIKRLEAATSRLEDIASSTFDRPTAINGAPGALSAGIPPPPRASQAAIEPPQAPAEELPPQIEAYDDLMSGDLKAFEDLSKNLGGPIAEQAAAVSEAFAAQRQFLLVATKAKKPDMASPTYMEVLKDLQQAIEKVDQIKQSSKAPELKNHLTMVGDGVGTLGWCTMDTKPADVAAELFGGAQMYGNKVLKDYKEKDRTHVDWVQSFYKLFRSLIAYIREYHPKGVQWNREGLDASEAMRQVKSESASTSVPPPAAAAGTGGGPPPPPPPPPPPAIPPPPPMPAPGASSAQPSDMGAVFADLNRGSDVTSGLRKVDPSQMTHKNPSLRAGSAVPERKGSMDSIGRSKSPAPPGKKPKPEGMRTKKPPKKELDGNKWLIENYDSPPEPIEIEASIIQSILISRCKNTTIRIIGKANAISLDNSARTSIILDSLVSSVDVIKCPNFALQVLGTLPTVLLDQVDGAAVYLSKDSLNTEIFTSKCTSININLPPADEEGDYTESPLPEQFKTSIKDGKLISEIVEHAG
ncbi:adenylyl cyclase-associated protein-like protein [Saccharata proteae CBS 121410]|uniref:Adenylyl cyclase-associated protein n=1 Tax=Saccharata proteae CBS 121410 TaxID=1314787 RepID=A0A6A5YDB5_9PEZI|nr:adenylyl cyclase-associated protein-like protein [Saccharata proteae CBS 121410]